MKFKLSYNKIEPFVFFIVLFISLYPILSNTFNPSLDGPAHLYNSSLLNYYFSNPIIDQYFYLNKIPSPNLFSHLFISFFNIFFKASISEKIFFLFYYLSFPLALRYFIKTYNPTNIFLSIIGIPLSHAYLFYMGFYNFSISFSFMFIAIGLYYKYIYNKDSVKLLHYVILFLLITVTYFSGVLSYVYLLGVLFIYEIITSIYLYNNGLIKAIKIRFLKNILIIIPTLICLIVFYTKINFPSTNTNIPKTELLRNLLNFNALIIYEFSKDDIYTKLLLTVIFIMIGYIIAKNTMPLTDFIKKHFDSNVFLAISILTLAAYFKIDDGASAGMMSSRLANLFFVFLILWVVSQKGIHFPKILIVFILIPHYYLHQIHSEKQKEYNTTAIAITESNKHIKENSIVLPINLMNKWIFMMGHFPNYLGVNKPLIILENYEANLQWFPLNWDFQSIPKFTLNNKETINNITWPKNSSTSVTKEIDYVYVFGELNEINTDEIWKDLKQNLDSAYSKSYQDEKNKIAIFKHK